MYWLTILEFLVAIGHEGTHQERNEQNCNFLFVHLKIKICISF